MIIRMIKSGRMSWTDHVALMADKKRAQHFWSENLKGRNQLENLGVDRKVLLNECTEMGWESVN
jgi:hypothetical protein